MSLKLKNKDKYIINILSIDQINTDYQDSLKIFITQQMKETNTLKVKKFRRKYKDQIEVVGNLNKIEEQHNNEQNTYQQIIKQKEEGIQTTVLLQIIENLSK